LFLLLAVFLKKKNPQTFHSEFSSSFSYSFNYFLGFHLRILAIKRYKTNSIIIKLKEVLKNEPNLILIEPIGRIISSHFILVFEIKGLSIGKNTSLTKDCIKFEAAIATINPIEIPIILYSLRKSLKSFKTATLFI